MERKSQKIELIIAAAEKFWGIRDFSAKELQGIWYLVFYWEKAASTLHVVHTKHET